MMKLLSIAGCAPSWYGRICTAMFGRADISRILSSCAAMTRRPPTIRCSAASSRTAVKRGGLSWVRRRWRISLDLNKLLDSVGKKPGKYCLMDSARIVSSLEEPRDDRGLVVLGSGGVLFEADVGGDSPDRRTATSPAACLHGRAASCARARPHRLRRTDRTGRGCRGGWRRHDQSPCGSPCSGSTAALCHLFYSQAFLITKCAQQGA